MKHTLLVTLFAMVTLATCAPIPNAVPTPTITSPVMLLTPLSSETPEPTVTLLPTETATPIPFPTGTATATARPTATSTLTPTPIPITFELLGIPASYKPNALLWSLWDLQLWHDRIYLAHGNYQANTGPIRAIYLDLTTGQFVHDEDFNFDDEGIEKFRVYNDVLYAPGTDAKESWDFGNLYFKQWDSKWTKLRTLQDGVHIFDVAQLADALVVTGIAKPIFNDTTAWSSRDNGQSWKFDVTVPAYRATVFVLNNHLYLVPNRDSCFVRDSETWQKVDCLPSPREMIYKNDVFQNIAVMAPYFGAGAEIISPDLYFFDGRERWTLKFDLPVRDIVSTKDGLFVLTGTFTSKGAIYWAPRLSCHCPSDFSTVARFDLQEGRVQHPSDNSPISLEYANGRFYIGFSDGRLFRSSPYQP